MGCRSQPLARGAFVALVLALAALAPVVSQAAAAARRLITTPIDDASLVRLVGNTRPEAAARYDAGRLPDGTPLEHMLLQLRRPAEREAAFQGEITRLHDRRSPQFHQWLTVRQLAEQYGPATEDVVAVAGWLRSHGFRVNTLYPSRLVIDFSGTAGKVHAAFHTEMHALNVRGQHHIANMSDPAVPAALAPVVVGIVSLNDFRPQLLYRRRTAYTVTVSGTVRHLVTPGDLATIYNFNPTFAAGISGQGQTVVVVEDSDMTAADFGTFRSTFGLSSSYPSGSLNAPYQPPPPSGPNNCADPGVVKPDESEATLDAEWSSAAAPSATIEVASCAQVGTTSGVFIALENLLNAANPPAILSVSFLSCEAGLGAAANAAVNALYSQGVALGTSVFVAAGDSGGADCDDNDATATHGIGVNGLASTPYDLAAGGTDFGDTYSGTTASYWSAGNNATFASALSYIPEIPWNDSCAGTLLASFHGFATPYGSTGFCNVSKGAPFITTAGGSGGPSGCASGAPATSGVVGGTCQGYAKPSWQSGVAGIPSDGVRDIPDVSLFAANGIWNHYYVVCDSNDSGCTGVPVNWSGGGGTSFAAPILAGIQALINQKVGAAQGNPDAIYYALAADQQASGLNCNSTSGNAAASGCILYDVTLGDMSVDCTGSFNCFLPSGTYGVLSTSDGADQAAYAAAPGWDFATGLGTPNVSNVVKYWAAYNTVASLVLSGSDSFTAGGDLSYVLKVTNEGPKSATAVTVSAILPSGFSLVTSLSSAGCVQHGQTVTCPVGSGTLGVGAQGSLTVVLAPAGSSGAVTFTASDGQTDLDPAAATVSLNEPGDVSDGPMPMWAIAALALALLAVTHFRALRMPGARRRA